MPKLVPSPHDSLMAFTATRWQENCGAKTNVGLEFSVPKRGTCCYNWDSSKSQTPDHTRWWIGENSYPDDKINNKAIEQVYAGVTEGERKTELIEARVKAILAEKAQLKNYDFRICVEIPIRAKILNMEYSCIPSYERERIGGKKKVNAIKDGLLILSEIVKYFYKDKI